MTASELLLISPIALFVVAAGMLTFLIVGIRRDDRTQNLRYTPRSRVEATTRRLLGVGVRTPESNRDDEE